MFEHFLLCHTTLRRNREASLRLSPWHGSHGPALRLAAEDGALVPDAQPHPASEDTAQVPAHFPVFRERQVQE